MKTLLTDSEQRHVTNARTAQAALKAVNDYLAVATIIELLLVIQDLDKRAVIALRDEKYKWRNLLVDWIEQAENAESDLDAVTLRYIYERIVAEHASG